MSSIGHVLDMVRRDKENRELRKKFGNRNPEANQHVLKSKKDVKDISLSEIENIRSDIEKKNKEDENVMSKNMMIMLLGSVVIVIIIFFILLVLGKL